ncbi:uncharacterized protein BCR38DRAFT_488236 [Pseudomassariella vexata]|uniref:Ribosomal protein S15-like protein n=1 Tax=Pseudomassariella vexata TaxID=1141098 RepID=A0A1Y2DLB2_9PEZI|nr:uncharacterized protein BCR38DRAFT_488236 [Pseudomassariella vexata]ORY60043.1 hypothetical protein BCR38DRAFT_488236 [Pseudomassariella vexata]
MPPRITGVPRLGGALNLCIRPASKPSTPSLLPLTQTASLSQKEKKKIAKQDPYRWAQMQQRKAAHAEIKEKIAAERSVKLGDQIRGLTTPFVESFDSAGQAPLSTPPTDDDGNPLEEPHSLPTSPHLLNNLASREELNKAIKRAYTLTKPMVEHRDTVDPEKENEALEKHTRDHLKAKEALSRIVHLDNGNAKDRRHANIRRCIETFGRHITDKKVKQKALSRGIEEQARPVRAGPDTGSSEVQIAILTAKIRALANELEKGRGYKDKVGKRDLRLMVHKRQRLLRYMERKERGSGRWTHMIETLGLGEATWKNQITF